MNIKLTPYQQKILDKLKSGAILSYPDLGHCTPAARFWGKGISRDAVNWRTLEVLVNAGIVQTTTGRFEGNFATETFYHVPGDKPWMRIPKHCGQFKPGWGRG